MARIVKPTRPVLDGLWVYTIHGLAQWTNPVRLGFDPSFPLEVGWAFAGAADPAENAEYQTTTENFTPIPLTVVNLEPFLPVQRNADQTRVHVQPVVPGTATGGASPPVSGYLPYAESGQVTFTKDGTLDGTIWFTIAGNSNFTTPVSVRGRFKFNVNANRLPAKSARGNLPPIGAFSFIWDFRGTHFNWDYAFIMVSNDEMQLNTIGRLPRPVTASGTMKRADWASIPREVIP